MKIVSLLVITTVLLTTSCSEPQQESTSNAGGNAPVHRSSRLVYDPAFAAVSGTFIYDPHAPVLQAKQFLSTR